MTTLPITSLRDAATDPAEEPPKPVTVPTAFLEKTYTGRVILPQAAWPNITATSSRRASAGLDALVMRRHAASIPQETNSIVLLRARFREYPD